MSLPAAWRGRLALPALAAPMFLASTADLAVECCRCGVIGTAPALNQRDNAGFEQYLREMAGRLARVEAETGRPPAPHGVNLSLRRGNPRLDDDLRSTVAHQVPLVITSLGIAPDIVRQIHDYGGLVFHDVINMRFAEKAAGAGVDGLIAVAAGAGGHGGALNPFAFLAELRRGFAGTLVLAGAINTGRQIAAALLMGADMVSMGTRFLATQESGVPDAYKNMILGARAANIIYTPHITGVHANFLAPSLREWNLDPDHLGQAATDSKIDSKTRIVTDGEKTGKVWRDIWSAGQGVGTIEDIPAAAALCQRLTIEFTAAGGAAD